MAALNLLTLKRSRNIGRDGLWECYEQWDRQPRIHETYDRAFHTGRNALMYEALLKPMVTLVARNMRPEPIQNELCPAEGAG